MCHVAGETLPTASHGRSEIIGLFDVGFENSLRKVDYLCPVDPPRMALFLNFYLIPVCPTLLWRP